MKRIFGLVAALCLLGANAAFAGNSIRVMTRNLYVGTDLDAVLSASRSELPIAVAHAYATFLSTNYAARMAAIADEIASIEPHLVGLQEVTLLRRQSPGDSLNLPPASTPAETVEADFLATLLYELNNIRGLGYRVVAQVQNFDVEIPMATGPDSYTDLRLTDRDVILARWDVDTVSDAFGTYAAALHFQTATITRGWVAVDARINGTTVHFFSTHLEDTDAGLRYAQSLELIRILARKGPTILVGDFNNETSDDLAYRALLAAGYTDHWPGPDPGYTCCQAADLKSVSPATVGGSATFKFDEAATVITDPGAPGALSVRVYLPLTASRPAPGPWSSAPAPAWEPPSRSVELS